MTPKPPKLTETERKTGYQTAVSIMALMLNDYYARNLVGTAPVTSCTPINKSSLNLLQHSTGR